MTIRPATRADVPRILGFIRSLAVYEKLLHEVAATEALIEEALFGEDPSAECLLGELDGEAVGFALFYRTFSTFLAKPGLHLEDLFVEPEHRGRGVGKALLARLTRIARERGYGRVEWSVLDWNAPSIAFYESLGAKAMDEWTVYRLTSEASFWNAE